MQYSATNVRQNLGFHQPPDVGGMTNSDYMEFRAFLWRIFFFFQILKRNISKVCTIPLSSSRGEFSYRVFVVRDKIIAIGIHKRHIFSNVLFFHRYLFVVLKGRKIKPISHHIK